MTPVQVITDESLSAPYVNDFCITFSTVNGSGSATANLTVLRALFKMGIPVSGRNIFPSNIKGLPTWFTIRVSEQGYLGRLEKDAVVVAMNQKTILEEADWLVNGGVLLYADHLDLPRMRDDIVLYPMPIKKISSELEIPRQIRTYVENMIYVGILAQVLEIDLSKVKEALAYHFKEKHSALDMNYGAVRAGFDWAAENLVKKDPYRVAPMNATEGYILADGNSAAALGSIYGGMQFSGWYPITPATSLPEALIEYLPLLRTDEETGKASYAIVQAEDELSAIGMTIGAGWGGLRAMTATSGPGLSLMAEYLGLAYYAEVPVVVWDVQRVGPSTGLPTRSAQGDLTFAHFMGHGDTQFIILIPGSVRECFEFGWRALDIAEEFQTPVIVMSDLDLGMNHWLSKPFEYPDEPIKRGKVLWEKDFEAIEERLNVLGKKWGRYLDIDGDGVPYRTVPGNRRIGSSYFARGTGHDDYAGYSEDPETWKRGLDRLSLKLETAKEVLPKPVDEKMEKAEIGIITSGSTYPAVEEARDLLAKKGIRTDYLRIRALPFTDEVPAFICNHEKTYVIETNRDGQLKQLLTLEFPDLARDLRKLSKIDGMPLSAAWITDQIVVKERD
ncbi:MAG: 2-oxoacid:acceptor oxidoreductase subunit alpha [Anaerolineaceae bacterium]|nr:2-oxoacid:acceptor oxidoreductase subunit alpha [Anaerolineaceae bacterium]